MKQSDPRALVLTALPVEYAAVRAHLVDIHEEEDAVGTVYEVGTFGEREYRWRVCLCEVGARNVGAATSVERALLHFHPNVAFFVGVAGGIKDVSIGDVVVATKVYGYESGKENTEKLLPRPEVGNSAYRLIQRARAEARKSEWHSRLGKSDGGPLPRAYIAPIAAGEKVVASSQSQTAKFLKANYGDAFAVEMEGAGFLRALHAHVDTAALVVRGISDLLSGKAKADSAGSQQLASRNAAAFAMAVLAGLGVAPGAYEFPVPENRKRVFISYSHDSHEHQDRVRELAQQLRADGIDCSVDLFERETPSMGWPLWMERQVSESDVVLVVCSKTFLRRFSGEDALDPGLGAAWEAQITHQTLRAELPESRKFVPILFEGATNSDVPMPLRGVTSFQLPAHYEGLLRQLSAEPTAIRPSIGPPQVPPPPEHRGFGEEGKARPTVKVFLSYSHRDESYREELSNHLAVLSRQGIIELWHDRRISPGGNWEGQIDSALNEADIVILLISADFLASDYCYDREMAQALEQHRTGKTRVVPIIVRPCDWTSALIGSLQALPRDARPVSTWANADDAWLDIARSLRTLAKRDAEPTNTTGHISGEPKETTTPPHVFIPIEVVFPREASLNSITLCLTDLTT